MSNETMTRAKPARDGKVMIRQSDGTFRESETRTDWPRGNAMTEEQIEAAALADSDAPPLDDEFWRTAKVVVPARAPKRHQGLRLDADILDWFRSQGAGWQIHMNAVLRTYVDAQRRR